MGSICGPTSIQLPNQSGPPPEVLANYRDLVNQAKTASANLPGLPGPPVAPLTQQQLGGINNVDLTTGMAAPYFAQGLAGLTTAQGTVGDAGKYIPQAAGMIGAGAGYYGTGADLATQGAANVTPMAFSDDALSRYMSPYTQHVIDTTMANIGRNNDIQQNNLRGSAILGGNAFGGDRAGIAAAELARNQDMASNQTMANLWNQNYSQALGEFNTQQGVDLGAQENNMARKLQAAGLYGSFGQGMGGLGSQYSNLAATQGGLGATQGNLSGTIAGLGSQATNTALASALAQIQAGGIARGVYQDQNNSTYQSLINSLGLSTPGYLAPFILGTGSQWGTEGYTTQAGPSVLTQVGGILAGITGLAKGKLSNSGGRIYGYDDGGAVDGGGGYSLGDMEAANALVREFVEAQQANQHAANLQQGIGFAEGGMAGPGFAGLNLEGFNGAPLPIYRAGLAGLFSNRMPAAGRRDSSHPPAPPPQMPNEGIELGKDLKTIAPWVRDKLSSSDEPGKPLSLDPEGYDDGGGVQQLAGMGGMQVMPQIGGMGGPQIMPQTTGMPSAGYKPDFSSGAITGNPTPLPVGLVPQNPPEGMMPPGTPAQGFTMPNAVPMPPRGYGMASARPMALQRPMGGQPHPWGRPGMGVRPQMQGLSGIPGLGGMAGYSAGGVAGSGRVFESRGYADEPLSFDSRSGSGNAFDPADYGVPDDITDASPYPRALKSYGTRRIEDMGAPPSIDATDVVLRNQPPPGTEVEHDNAALAADRTLDGPVGVKTVSYRAPVQPPDATADTPMRSAAPSRDRRSIDEITIPSAPSLPLAPPGLGGLGEVSTKGKVDPWLALAAFGFGTAAGNSPWFGVNVGRGGLAAVQNIADQREQTRQDMTVGNRAKQLEEQAAKWRAELARQTTSDANTENYRKAKIQQAADTLAETKRKTDLPVLQHELDPETGELKFYSVDREKGTYTKLTATQAQRLADQQPAQAPLPGSDQGTANVNSAQPYNYSKSAPYIEKGMVVPDPAPVSGKSSYNIMADGHNYLQTKQLPPVSRGQSPVAIRQNNYRDAVQNYGAALAQSRGLTPEQTAEIWRSAPGMLKFILGKQGESTVSLGTAVRHLDTMQELLNVWDSGSWQTANALRAKIEKEFGKEAATNVQAAAHIVGPEILKAIGIAGAGSKEEREKISAQFSTASSPTQARGLIGVTQALMGGQLEGKRRQARESGVSDERFKNLIGERPYEVLTNMEKGHGEAKGATPAAPTAPTRPSSVPAGSSYSPSLNQWRSKDGKFFDASGKPVNG